MNVVILHCHFQRGGVTQVVENHVRSLIDDAAVDRIVLVSGHRADGLSETAVSATEQLQIGGFDYDDIEKPITGVGERGEAIARHLTDALNELGVDKDQSVLHWHNHSLGKNTAAPAAIRSLAQSGWRLLLQIHDFAEDNRPENYGQLIRAVAPAGPDELDAYLYPSASQIHYAGLTRADASVIAKLGIPQHQTHCLPNSVAPPPTDEIDNQAALDKVRQLLNLPRDACWTLYPVRGIRRKNVGEFLLLSRLMGEATFTGLTLCPVTPMEKLSYERWRTLATEVAPHAIFDVAHHQELSFAENLAATRYVISTSVAEGFGMAFLEPWLARRRVVARRLPSVTNDFGAAGVDLWQLYDQIPIPGDTHWVQQCQHEIEQAFQQAWSDLPPQYRPRCEVATDAMSDAIDFARLTPQRQIDVLQQMASDTGFDKEVAQRSESLVVSLLKSSFNDASRIKQNCDVVASEYSIQKRGADLLDVYRELINTRPGDVAPPQCQQSAIELVSQVRPFFPCRTELLDE